MRAHLGVQPRIDIFFLQNFAGAGKFIEFAGIENDDLRAALNVLREIETECTAVQYQNIFRTLPCFVERFYCPDAESLICPQDIADAQNNHGVFFIAV